MKKVLVIVAIIVAAFAAFVIVGNTVGHHLTYTFDEPVVEEPSTSEHVYYSTDEDGNTLKTVVSSTLIG